MSGPGTAHDSSFMPRPTERQSGTSLRRRRNSRTRRPGGFSSCRICNDSARVAEKRLTLQTFCLNFGIAYALIRFRRRPPRIVVPAMPTFDRRFLLGSAMAAVPPALLLCVLTWSPGLLADAWQVPWLKPAYRQEQRRGGVGRAAESVRRRSEVRRAIALDMAEGRLTLLEAAGRSRDLDLHSPISRGKRSARVIRPPRTNDGHCREAIEQLRCYQPLGPSATEELARRLEEELREHLARGTLRLPLAACGFAVARRVRDDASAAKPVGLGGVDPGSGWVHRAALTAGATRIRKPAPGFGRPTRRPRFRPRGRPARRYRPTACRG